MSSSWITTLTPAALATSFSTVATPPRVASRSARTPDVAASRSATSPPSGAVSEATSASMSSSPRASMMVTPWSPIGPETITASPGRALARSSAPFEVRPQLHGGADGLQRRGVPIPRHYPGVLVLHRAAPLRQLAHEHVDGLENVQRLEPGHNHGFAVIAWDELIRPAADHRRNVTWANEAVQPQVRRIEDRLDGRDDGDVIAEDREVLESLGSGAEHGHSRGRRRSLEADRHEYDALVWVLAGDLQRVQRGINHADVGTLCLRVEEGAVAARHPHHVAERGHDDTGASGQVHRVVDPPHRDYAHRAARAVHEGDALGQVVLHAVPVDRVGVPAAHLHQLVLAAGLAQAHDLRGQRMRLTGVTEFIDEPHACQLLLDL